MHYRRKAQPFNRDDRTSAAGESRCDGAHSVAHEVSAGESRRDGAHSVAHEVSAGESRRNGAHSVANEVSAGESRRDGAHERSEVRHGSPMTRTQDSSTPRRGARAKRENAGFIDTATGRILWRTK